MIEPKEPEVVSLDDPDVPVSLVPIPHAEAPVAQPDAALRDVIRGLLKHEIRWINRGYGYYACRSCGAEMSRDEFTGQEKAESCSRSCPFRKADDVLASVPVAPPAQETQSDTTFRIAAMQATPHPFVLLQHAGQWKSNVCATCCLKENEPVHAQAPVAVPPQETQK